MTEEELDRLVDLFGAFDKAREEEPRSALRLLFQTFVGMAINERFGKGPDGFEKVSKPSTIVAKQLLEIKSACKKLHLQLAMLDPATRTWLGRHLENIGARDEKGDPVGMYDMLNRIDWPLDHLIYAAHSAEEISSPGPNNAALRYMIECLANWWEEVYSRAPTTDKDRGRQPDPFLNVCREVVQLARLKSDEEKFRFGSHNLSGLVADVLKNRPF